MKQIIAVLNSNEVNRYRMVFPVRTLESALNQCWDLGTPSFLSHDCHRPIGWLKGLSLYFEPALVRSTGLFLIPENEKESSEIAIAVRNYVSKYHTDFIKSHRQELKNKLKPYLSGKELSYAPSCAAFIDEDLARKVFPGIFDQQDADGLIPISLLTSKAPGVFEKDGLLLFAHPFFRRSLSRLNTINEPFFKVLQPLTPSDLSVRIALDENMIGLSSTFQQPIELEYWWGPKFNEDLISIPDGVTHHVADEIEQLFHGISATEFWWYSRKGEKIFECEELRDVPSCGVSSNDFGCRYVHCILNSSKDGSAHLDGAIRLYEEESMAARLDTNIRNVGRHSKYIKLWRIEGHLKVSAWKEIITHYFRDNHLIGEYFGANKESFTKKGTSKSNVKKYTPLYHYIPCDMKAGQGIRISISYHPKTESSKSAILIKSFDSITRDSTEYKYVEADTIEIVKCLHQDSLNLKVPDHISFVSFGDTAVNFPLILHFGLNSYKRAAKTQNVIAKLCNVWNNRGDDRVVSYNNGIQYSDIRSSRMKVIAC